MFQQVLINSRGLGKFSLFADFVKLELENHGSTVIHCNNIDNIKRLRDIMPFRFYFYPVSDFEGRHQANIYKLMCISDADLKYNGKKIAVICPNHNIFNDCLNHLCFDKLDTKIYHCVTSIRDTRGYRFLSYILPDVPASLFGDIDVVEIINNVRACLY